MVLPFHTVTQSAAETQSLGEKFGASLLKVSQSERGDLPRVICLWGELGSGKTTFIQGVARGLGVTSRILSPTFIIVRRYKYGVPARLLYHLDLYRLNNPEDALHLGFTEMVHDPESIMVIEWPERLGQHIPEKRIDIRFETNADDSHTIQATKH